MKRKYKTNGLGIAFFMISLIKSAIAIELPDDLKQEVNAYFHTAKPLCERILNRESYITEESTLKLFEDLGTFLEDKEMIMFLTSYKELNKENTQNKDFNIEKLPKLQRIKSMSPWSITFFKETYYQYEKMLPTSCTLSFINYMSTDYLREEDYTFLNYPFMWDIFRLTLIDKFMRHFYNLSKKILTTKIKDKVDVTTLIFPEPVGLYEKDGERVNIRNTVGYANTSNLSEEDGLIGQLCKTIINHWVDKESTLKEVKKLTTYFDENDYKRKVIIFF